MNFAIFVAKYWWLWSVCFVVFAGLAFLDQTYRDSAENNILSANDNVSWLNSWRDSLSGLGWFFLWVVLMAYSALLMILSISLQAIIIKHYYFGR